MLLYVKKNHVVVALINMSLRSANKIPDAHVYIRFQFFTYHICIRLQMVQYLDTFPHYICI